MTQFEKLDTYVSVDRVLESIRDRVGTIVLDSGSHSFGFGQYSVLVTDPIKEIISFGDTQEVRTDEGIKFFNGNPFDLLRNELSLGPEFENRLEQVPFCGGAVGYFSYDFGRRLKPTTLKAQSDRNMPDYRFGIYDSALVWDHSSKVLYASADPGSQDPESSIKRLRKLVDRATDSERIRSFDVGELVSNFTRDSYLEQIGKLRELIREGEIYQANFSHQFRARFEGSGIDLYRKLRESNPAPYAAYLNFGDEEILSSSPERFLKYEEGLVQTRPIKGTRPRGESEAEERRFSEELARSEKDKAELLMIVDLERNGLGKVCQPGSIEVEGLYSQETYASVIHQTASVKGRIAKGRGAIDCIEAMFPGGSITGTPKIRAMEVIDALESVKRGIYTGSIGYIGFDGRADFNIAIRTMRIKDSEIAFNVGGGIVWDSDPISEYEETLLKAKAIFDALGKGKWDAR
tara:strand:- start:7189 stop:8574 length:1386 start_codon:yes stop_codon:yes gene_type:complete